MIYKTKRFYILPHFNTTTFAKYSVVIYYHHLKINNTDAIVSKLLSQIKVLYIVIIIIVPLCVIMLHNTATNIHENIDSAMLYPRNSLINWRYKNRGIMGSEIIHKNYCDKYSYIYLFIYSYLI